MISTVDPQARHARKTSAHKRDGYKGHLAVEPETGLVTECALTAAAAPDGPTGIGLLGAEQSGLEVLGDSAYGGGETRAALRFISPWIIGFLLFTAYPVVYTAYLSLTDYDVINDPSFVGLENYRELLSDEKVTLALRNTFVYTAMSVPTQLVFSLGLALLLQRAGRAAGFFRTAFFLPKMTPPVAVGVLLLLLLNGQSGLAVVGRLGPSAMPRPCTILMLAEDY